MNDNVVKAAIPVVVGLGLWILPSPTGLDLNAWNYFALFAAVVAALVLEPIPPALAGLIGVTLATVFRLVPITPGQAPTTADAIKWCLSGFSDGTLWLIFSAFMFALGYEKTGLGKRVALSFIKLMEWHTLGLGYAVSFADLLLAPFMLSVTVRSGGTIFPVIRNIPPLYQNLPDRQQYFGSNPCPIHLFT